MATGDGALSYLDEQIEALRIHVPAALGAFDATGIHQARVATRRLKAGLDLLSPLLDEKKVRSLATVGKKLRRRLGPLRDLDVMIDGLQSFQVPARLTPAVAWMTEQLDAHRQDARREDQAGKRPAKLLGQFDDWWSIRHTLASAAPEIEPLLSGALHQGFDQFSDVADWVSGLSTPPEEHGPVDVHELRIDGKALRYSFEIAGAHGIKVPKDVFKSFKAMQEALGTWHDFVVLAEETMQRSLDTQLAHHDPERAALVLDLAKLFVSESVKALNQFRARWRRSGQRIRRTIHDRVPLSRDVSQQAQGEHVIESGTDPDRPETEGTPPPDTSPQVVPPGA